MDQQHIKRVRNVDINQSEKLMQNFQQLAEQYDTEDPVKSFRDKFFIPKNSAGHDKIYFCGHSLGLQPKTAETYIKAELERWENLGVEGHFTGKNPWRKYHETVTEGLAKITGSLTPEVIAMNSLTTNLHLLMTSFYKPSQKRYKILIEAGAFPSDRYAVHSHANLHGYAIEDAVIEIPAAKSGLIELADIENIFKKHGAEIALVLLPGVQFLTGQALPIKALTEMAHQYGCIIGWDMAHAIGNIPLKLHEWQCDFAVWCHYKYLNAGPGAIGGCFVHETHLNQKDMLRLAGWWGHDEATRFDMPQTFQPSNSIAAWQLSNPPIFQLAVLRASLEIFSQIDFKLLREKSLKLTGFLRDMLQALLIDKVQIITAENHGAQLSLRILGDTESLVKNLLERSVVCDFRKPNIMRVAPMPLYNSFHEVYRFVTILAELL